MPTQLKLESRIPAAVADTLRRQGHFIEIVEPYAHVMGHAGATPIDQQTPMQYGASDSCSDGMVACY